MTEDLLEGKRELSVRSSAFQSKDVQGQESSRWVHLRLPLEAGRPREKLSSRELESKRTKTKTRDHTAGELA